MQEYVDRLSTGSVPNYDPINGPSIKTYSRKNDSEYTHVLSDILEERVQSFDEVLPSLCPFSLTMMLIESASVHGCVSAAFCTPGCPDEQI